MIDNATKEDLEKIKELLKEKKYKYAGTLAEAAEGREIYIYTFKRKGRLIGFVEVIRDFVNDKIINLMVVWFGEYKKYFVKDLSVFYRILSNTYQRFELSILENSPGRRLAERFMKQYNIEKIAILKDSIKINGVYEDLHIYERK